MTRWPYFGSVFAINLFTVAIEPSAPPNFYWFCVIAGAGLWIYWTVLRCDDIGINRWWALAVILPLAPLYFIFAPKRQRLSAGIMR